MFRRVQILSIDVARKKKKFFVQAHAKLASKLILVNPGYAEKMKNAVERLYTVLSAQEQLDLVKREEDVACTAFLVTGLREFGGDRRTIIKAFEANEENVLALWSAFEGNYEDNKDEID